MSSTLNGAKPKLGRLGVPGSGEGKRGSPYREPAKSEPIGDPMSRILAQGPRLPVAFTVGAAIVMHVGVAAGATAAALYNDITAYQAIVKGAVNAHLSQYEMDVVKEKEPEPPPPEPVKEPEPEPVKANTPPPVKDEAPPPPPAPAEAGKILAAEPDPKDPVDLTNSFVTGNGNTYAGGNTSANGTSKGPVYNPFANKNGVPGGTGTAPSTSTKVGDRSRAPGLLGSVDWNDCPFPGEADAEQVDQAFVMISVKVKPDGSPENVSVIQDPGHGFGREARKCAMRKKYSQGLDADGNAVGGQTKPFRVRFER